MTGIAYGATGAKELRLKSSDGTGRAINLSKWSDEVIARYFAARNA